MFHIFNQFSEEQKILQIGLRALCNPILDAFNSQNVINDLLQIWMIGDQIFLRHVIQVIQNSGEIEVCPREL